MSCFRNLLFLLAFVLTCPVVCAQGEKTFFSIQGRLESEEKLTSDWVIALWKASEKTLVKIELLSEAGNYLFQDIEPDDYYLSVSENGNTSYTGPAFNLEKNLVLEAISLPKKENKLKEVVVQNNKSFIERQDGKTVLNIENSIAAAGSSAFELLEKAPSIRIDQNDNISLQGKSGVMVQIDGKRIEMSGSNLANYLRGIPSGAIEKIEFITNPSSKYDAAGTSIINIKMKKEKRKGTNGNVSISLGQGQYPKNNNNLSLNHRNKKINLFGNYSFAYREGFNRLILDRSFYENGLYNGAYDQNNFLKMTFRNHLARAGFDYILNEKNTIGVLVNGVANNFDPVGNNNSDVFDATGAKVSEFQTKSSSKERWKNGALNLNHKYVIDTLGTEWTTDFDCAVYGNRNQQDFNTNYLNLDGTTQKPEYRLHGNLNGDLSLYAIKSDFVTNLKSKIKLETGIKSSYVKADNHLAFYNRSSGTDIFDASKSNHFIYKENINAGYINASKAVGKWNFQFGLRIEHTNILGEQRFGGVSFENQYTQLFPSGLLSYALSPKHNFELNYSRRIQRPGYDQLNPFKFYLDETTYKTGNPKLGPQTTHSLEFTHSFQQKIFATLSFSRTDDVITESISPSETEERVTVQTNRNLDHVNTYGLFLVLPFEINSWWETTNNLNFYANAYSGTVSNTTLTNAGNFTWNFNTVNNFKLGRGFFAEFSANYQAREIYAFDRVNPIWFVNSGLQKKFKNKSNLKLAFNDMFNTNEISATTRFVGYTEHFVVKRDTRVVVLSYTYNFGSGNSMPRRKGGAEDLKQRAGTTQG